MAKQVKNTKYLLIKLQQVEVTTPAGKGQQPCLYYSFSLNDSMYFSSCVSASSQKLNDDIIMQVQSQGIPQTMQVCRWQNHMIMFTHHVDLAELKTRTTIMKNVETKAGEVLKMIITVLSDQQLKLGAKFIAQISQHYLIIESISLLNDQTSTNQLGPSYIQVKTSNQSYVMPVLNAKAIIKIPQSFQFFRIQNSKKIGKSSVYQPQQLMDSQCTIDLSAINGYKFSTKMKLHITWGINLLQPKPENILLLDSQEIMIYDIELKFENYAEYGNCKVKFVCGNKAFELGNDFNSAKPAKVKKIINFFTKSEDEDIIILVQKNLKIMSQLKFHIQEISPFVVNSIKKKITDVQGKQIGIIKFKGEKAKNLSTPSNNKFWRESLKNKNLNGMGIFAITQVSAKYQHCKHLSLVLKTQNQEKTMNQIPNFIQFDKNGQIDQVPVMMIIKQDESIYMMIKRNQIQFSKSQQLQKSSNSDFIGIALFNIAQTRFGMNCAEIKFYKNQILTGTINCLIQKVFAYPFVKPSFQPQILQTLSHKSLSLSLVMKQVYFSPYFYTYQYDNKNEVYCIVEINKVKKVLIMENRNKNQLSFTQSSSSDNLDFNIEETETIRVKVTFLVSDIGQDQQIYGWALVKLKASELQLANTALKYYLIEIKNQFGNNVGQINFQIYKAPLFNSHAKQSRDVLESGTRALQGENRKLKMHLAKISQSVEIQQRSSVEVVKEKPKQDNQTIKVFKNNQRINNHKKNDRYEKKIPSFSGERKQRNKSVLGAESSLKLPAIKEQPSSSKNRNSLNQLVQMMKIRKRSVKGHYQQNSMLESYQVKNFADKQKNRGHSSFDNSPPRDHTHLKQKIQKQNPNISRNMQILFPKKSARIQKNISMRKPIAEDEQKLKGLKSVMSEISHDMGQIQPTQKDQEAAALHVESKRSDRNNQKYYKADTGIQMNGPEWQDNEFAL